MADLRKRIVAVISLVAIVLTGCSLPDFSSIAEEVYRKLNMYDTVAYADMEYERPDMDELQSVLDDCCERINSAKSADEIMDVVYEYYAAYDWFYTCLNLADIKYSGDLTDDYWADEYGYCVENEPWTAASLDELYYAVAQSSFCEQLETDLYFGAGFFDAYTSGDYELDEELIALYEKEAQLQSAYYELTEESYELDPYSEDYYSIYGQKAAELYIDLIKVRQDIAEYAGYESYPEFAYDYYYYREYTPEQVKTYTLNIADLFYEMYVDVSYWDMGELVYSHCREEEMFAFVKDAAMAMEGSVSEAFELLEGAKLYDIEYRRTKLDLSYEVFLWSYYEPFVFLNPYLDQTDKLLFAHEFGHFAHDYVCGGTYASADVCEVNSHTMEYLSLCYGEDTDNLAIYKMADSLCLYVEQAAYALFELCVYELEEEDLTVENVTALYEEIGLRFGFDCYAWDAREYVAVEHFFLQPMYVISYVVSNDLAMQIYQFECEDAGSGLEIYEQCLTSSDEDITLFAEQLGLESPFEEGRLESVKATFEDILGEY